MGYRLAKKRNAWDSLICCSGTLQSVIDWPSYTGWPLGCIGMILSSASRLSTVTHQCHNRGGARHRSRGLGTIPLHEERNRPLASVSKGLTWSLQHVNLLLPPRSLVAAFARTRGLEVTMTMCLTVEGCPRSGERGYSRIRYLSPRKELTSSFPPGILLVQRYWA